MDNLRDIAAVKLKEISVFIASEDRKLAEKELSLTGATISKYLNGKVSNLSTAEKLLVFFRSILKRRVKLFNDVANELKEKNSP